MIDLIKTAVERLFDLAFMLLALRMLRERTRFVNGLNGVLRGVPAAAEAAKGIEGSFWMAVRELALRGVAGGPVVGPRVIEAPPSGYLGGSEGGPEGVKASTRKGAGGTKGRKKRGKKGRE